MLQDNSVCGETTLIETTAPPSFTGWWYVGARVFPRHTLRLRRPNLYIPAHKRRIFALQLQVRRIDRRTSSATRSHVLLARGIPLLEVGSRSVAQPPNPFGLNQAIKAIASEIRVVEHIMTDCVSGVVKLGIVHGQHAHNT